MLARPRILAIDTTSDWCSVALLHDQQCTLRAQQAGHDHSRLALPMIRSVLDERGVSLETLDAIAFGAGPGSFTGLRIACGIAQGLAYALSIPTVAVGSLEALAWAALESNPAASAIAAIDARMDEVYFAAFSSGGDDVSSLLPVEVAAPAVAADALQRWLTARQSAGAAVACGDAFERFEPLRALIGPQLALALRRLPSADAVARLGAVRLARGAGVPAAEARPLYVRDKVALDTAEQAALRARRAAAS